MCAFSAAYGGGFQLNLLGVRQIGMGHVGVALSPDASSVVFNPGSLAFYEKRAEISIGGSLVYSNAAFKNDDLFYTNETDNPVGTPINIFASYRIHENVTYGLGIYTPFGSTTDWGEDWLGRNLIQDISLKAIFIQPTVSVKLNDKLGIGAGLVIATGSVDLNRAIPTTPEGSSNLNGDALSYGGNIGIFYQPVDKLNIGIDFRSKVIMDVNEGEATFNVPNALIVGDNFPSSTTFDAKLPLPSTLTVGIGYNVSNKLFIETDLSWVKWSDYTSLDFDFANDEDYSSLDDSKNPRNYKDSYIIRLGAEYTASEKLDLRAGAYFDPAPSNEKLLNPETPDTDRVGMTLGASYDISDRFTAVTSLLYIVGTERDIAYEPSGFSGTIKSAAFIPGISISYSID